MGRCIPATRWLQCSNAFSITNLRPGPKSGRFFFRKIDLVNRYIGCYRAERIVIEILAVDLFGTEDLNTLYVFQWVGGPNDVFTFHRCQRFPTIRFLLQVLLHFVGFACFIGPTIMLELPVRHPAS